MNTEEEYRTIHPIDTIVSDQAVRGGQPIISGTSIRISDLAASHVYRGQSAEELATNFRLDMGQVYAALAYYFQHKAEIAPGCEAMPQKQADR